MAKYLPPSKHSTSWQDMIGESTHADAILDWLVHASIKIELKGDL